MAERALRENRLRTSASRRDKLERGSESIAESFQVGAGLVFEAGGLRKLTMQFGDEARHLLDKRVAVVFDFLGADGAAGGEDVAVRGDFGGGGGFAEAGDVGVSDPRSPLCGRGVS